MVAPADFEERLVRRSAGLVVQHLEIKSQWRAPNTRYRVVSAAERAQLQRDRENCPEPELESWVAHETRVGRAPAPEEVRRLRLLLSMQGAIRVDVHVEAFAAPTVERVPLAAPTPAPLAKGRTR